MPKLNTIDVKGEIEKRLKDPEFLREWIDAQIEGVFPQIMKAHAEIWREQANHQRDCLQITSADTQAGQIMRLQREILATHCQRIAERYESKAAQETEG